MWHFMQIIFGIQLRSVKSINEHSYTKINMCDVALVHVYALRLCISMTDVIDQISEMLNVVLTIAKEQLQCHSLFI